MIGSPQKVEIFPGQRSPEKLVLHLEHRRKLFDALVFISIVTLVCSSIVTFLTPLMPQPLCSFIIQMLLTT